MDKKERLSKGLLKLGELAKKAGLTQGTIRHYVNMGLIHNSETTAGGFRLFDERNTVARIVHIQRLVASGKTLEQIRVLGTDTLPAKEILVVDDNLDVSDLIKDVVKDRIDANIKVALDGFQAGSLLGEYIPDLIILDLHLPGVDGFKICENTKNDPRLARAKILAVTGYGSEESEQKILASGADAYLAKPFDTSVLLKMMCTLLNIEVK